jgi:hypothetical protein
MTARWRVLLAAVVTTSACSQVLGPTKVDDNWHMTESAYFTLHARPATFADQSAAALGGVLDDQYEVTQRLLGAAYGSRINGFLYNDAADANFESEHSGVAFTDTAAFRATATPPLDANLFALVAHEANHVIIIGALGRANTHFMAEGLASAVISERYHPLGPHYYYQWTKAHKAQLVPLATLIDDDRWNHIESNVAYSESASFLAYLLETQGSTRLRQVYYSNSGGFESRFSQVYGLPLASAEASWLAFCESTDAVIHSQK